MTSYLDFGLCPQDSSIRCTCGIARGGTLRPCDPGCSVRTTPRAERVSREQDALAEELARAAAPRRKGGRRRFGED